MIFLQDPPIAADPPPWWGIPVIAGSFLIGGALLGALFSYLATRSVERTRFAREDRVRWHERLFTTSSAFLATAASINNESQTLEGPLFAVELRRDKSSPQK